MITNYKIYENNIIENNSFRIMFLLSKTENNLFIIQYSININNKKLLLNHKLLKYLLTKIEITINNKLFNDFKIYKNSVNTYIISLKQLSYLILYLIDKKYYCMLQSKKYGLIEFLTLKNNKFEQNICNIHKHYNNVNIFIEDFNNFNYDNIDKFIEDKIILNNKNYFHSIIKICMSDEIKQKYSYLNNAKKFDII